MMVVYLPSVLALWWEYLVARRPIIALIDSDELFAADAGAVE